MKVWEGKGYQGGKKKKTKTVTAKALRLERGLSEGQKGSWCGWRTVSRRGVQFVGRKI